MREPLHVGARQVRASVIDGHIAGAADAADPAAAAPEAEADTAQTVASERGVVLAERESFDDVGMEERGADSLTDDDARQVAQRESERVARLRRWQMVNR